MGQYSIFYLVIISTFYCGEIFSREITSEAGSDYDQCLVERPAMFDLRNKVDQLQKAVDDMKVLVEQTHNCTCTNQNQDTNDQEYSVFSDCQAISTSGFFNGDGVYLIQPSNSIQPFEVYCEKDYDGIWTVIQKRMDSEIDFVNRYWADYRAGFGPIDSNHWLGNQKIHELTTSGTYTLRFNLGDWEGNSAYADYDGFYIEGEDDKYRLRYISYSGDAGDSLSSQKDMQFSTQDQDNDLWSNNCVTHYNGGAWWYSACFSSSLNGDYSPTSTTDYAKGIVWVHWKGYYYSLKTTTMKIKPIN